MIGFSWNSSGISRNFKQNPRTFGDGIPVFSNFIRSGRTFRYGPYRCPVCGGRWGDSIVNPRGDFGPFYHGGTSCIVCLVEGGSVWGERKYLVVERFQTWPNTLVDLWHGSLSRRPDSSLKSVITSDYLRLSLGRGELRGRSSEGFDFLINY